MATIIVDSTHIDWQQIFIDQVSAYVTAHVAMCSLTMDCRGGKFIDETDIGRTKDVQVDCEDHTAFAVNFEYIPTVVRYC